MAIPSIDLTDIVTADNRAAAVSAFNRAQTLMVRALKQDSAAVVRVRQAGEHSVDLFISTPLRCAASVRVPGRAEGAEVYMADQVLNALATYQPGQQQLDCGLTMGIRWPGSLPPLEGYSLVDTVPGQTFRDLHASMEKENAATPTGIARSLLDQTLLTITADGSDTTSPDAPAAAQADLSVGISGRIVAAMGGLGVVQQPKKSQLQEYDVVRVSATASWVRLDTLYATVFTPRPGGLARVP